VGLLTERLLSSAALDNVKELLNKDSAVNEYFALTFTWADKVKRTAKYGWARTLHYLGIKEN
jgi:hypothetical protein